MTTTDKGAKAPSTSKGDYLKELAALKEIADHDTETVHWKADNLLIAFLRDLGHDDVADAWEAVEPKWYA